MGAALRPPPGASRSYPSPCAPWSDGVHGAAGQPGPEVSARFVGRRPVTELLLNELVNRRRDRVAPGREQDLGVVGEVRSPASAGVDSLLVPILLGVLHLPVDAQRRLRVLQERLQEV